MKQLFAITALLTTLSVSADDRPVAPADLVEELKAYCQEIAAEDGTDGLDMVTYVLNCINDELESEGYQPVAALSN